MSLAKKLFILGHKIKNKQKVLEDTSGQETPQSTLAPASLTIEAALVFPLFLYLTLGMMFFFRVLQISVQTYGALYAAGSALSLEANEEPSDAKAALYFYSALAKKKFSDQQIVWGKAGIRWAHTDVSGDYIDLTIHYECKMPIRLLGLKNIPITQRVKMKKWTGYQEGAADGDEDSWVYVALNGTVYHLSRECTHLRLSIHTMGQGKVEAAGYRPCERCNKRQGTASYYYVTDEGEKYHTKLNCSGLKRTVFMVRMSQVGGKRACGRCKGGSWSRGFYWEC